MVRYGVGEVNRGQFRSINHEFYFIFYFILDFKNNGSSLESFRQGSHIIILCIYEPFGCCVKNELEEGQSKKQGDKLLQLSR